MRWYFVSHNKNKFEELAPLCRDAHIELVHHPHNTRERQLANFEDIVSDKAVEAFKILRSNVLVDHSGLEMGCLHGLPGGLTQLFWDRLEHRAGSIVQNLKDTSATVVTALGYCNGRKVWIEKGKLPGHLIPPTGTGKAQLNSIFQPQGFSVSYAELTIDQRNTISQRRDALVRLVDRLHSEQELR